MRHPLVLLALLLALVGGLVAAVDLSVGPPQASSAAEGEAAAARTAGQWVCPVGDTRGGTTLSALLAREPDPAAGAAPNQAEASRADQDAQADEPDAADEGEESGQVDGSDQAGEPGQADGSDQSGEPGQAEESEPDSAESVAQVAETVVSTVVAGQRRPVGVRAPSPGELQRLEVDAGGDAATVAQWRGGAPTGLLRSWNLEEDDELPPGTVAGSCVAEVAERWTVPGMTTAGGHEARLRLANPYDTDATVALEFFTPQGPERPTVLQNITVPSRGTTEVEVNEHLPEREDLAAQVEVVSGRVAVEGYQLAYQAVGGVDGASLLQAVTAPQEQWTIPWVADGSGRSSWLWVLNPGERPAPVELTLHGPDGGGPPEGLAEVTVAPGQLRRIDLRGTLPEDVGVTAVTVRSDGSPVYASGMVRREADDPARTGVAVQAGAQPHTQWVLGGDSPDGRDERLMLSNPGSEPSTVELAMRSTEGTVDLGEDATVEVGPGARVNLDLSDHVEGLEAWVIDATASAPVVAGRVGRETEGTMHLVAGPGHPRRGPGREDAPPALRDQTLPQRAGLQVSEPA